MRGSVGLAIGVALSLAAAAPAQADVTIAGLDTLTWDKTDVTIQPGETVTWTFAGTTQMHNVWVTGPNGFNNESTLGLPAPDHSVPFPDVGDYDFVCRVHPDMRGKLHVGTNTAPVELPPSAQPYNNDDGAAVPLETNVSIDKSRPGLSRVAAKRVAKGAARVRFRISEASDVSVAFKRAGRTVKSAVASGTGMRSVTVRGLRAGRYTVQVRATDIAGNRSKLRSLRLTVR